jgi:hypothetical protein
MAHAIKPPKVPNHIQALIFTSLLILSIVLWTNLVTR